MGRGAHQLARLYYEGTLASVNIPLSETLFRAFQDANESLMRQAIDSLPHIIARSHDSEQPPFAWADLLLAGGGLLAKEHIHTYSWGPLLAMLRSSLN
ncbi:hypothetical protein [Glutamicibacter sp. PS]|uniref:hypothetical protein n=1 Tax=Glutamicibacter sp. PS TaxID=3075634 RepID=UPI00283EEA17|nr:hypothetical protein [Glutamicibacter sp. PS]MDR4534749.1 hypothetical protein [Glutamicibacter sp. PS]